MKSASFVTASKVLQFPGLGVQCPENRETNILSQLSHTSFFIVRTGGGFSRVEFSKEKRSIAVKILRATRAFLVHLHTKVLVVVVLDNNT